MPKIKIFKKTQKRLDELGCTIEDDGGTITIDAPRGYILSCTGTHSVVGSYEKTVLHRYIKNGVEFMGWRDGTSKEVNEGIMEDLDWGIEPCTDPDCDICNDL